MRRGRMVRLLLACALGATGWSFMASGPGAADGGASSSGGVFATGSNYEAQLGTDDFGVQFFHTSPRPVSIAAATSFSAVAAGELHSCAITTTGTLYCWGWGGNGRLGTGNTTQRPSPHPVDSAGLPGQPTFSAISTGRRHSCALTTTGTPYCWGQGVEGQLGDGSNGLSHHRLSPHPVSISALAVGTTFAAISAGSEHTCAITSTGAAYCWGWGGNGRLGTGNTASRTSPHAVSASALAVGTTFAAISAGSKHTCAITSTGIPYCWGEGDHGRLGTGNTDDQTSPTPVSIAALAADTTFAAIAAGFDHTCAITTTGIPYCWGHGAFGKLGDGSDGAGHQRLLPHPVSISAGTTFATIATGTSYSDVGYTHTCAITTTSIPYCWGQGSLGKLGDGSTGGSHQRLSPHPVSIAALPASTFRAVAVGSFHTVFLSGTVTPSTPDPALTPTFDTPVATVDGFTVNVTNYDPLFTWATTVGAGTIATGSATGAVWPLTITGLTPGTSTTVTVSTTRAGYDAGTATVSGTAQAAPAGGSPPPIPTQTATTTTPSSTTSAPTMPSTTSAPTTTPPPATPAPDAGALEPPSAQTIADLPTRTLIEFSTLQAGATVTVTGDGFQANEPVVLAVASTPRVIATGVADTTGTVQLTGTIPLDLPAGQHTLVIYAPNSGHGQRQPITITAPYLPATGNQPSPVLAVLAVFGGLLALNLRWWRLRRR
jgi:alpha-tubulin suppressor-like RCC1 family protein